MAEKRSVAAGKKPPVGVYLRDAEPLIRLVRALFVKESELIHPEEALPRRGAVTVYLCNHGPVFAPFPAPALTAEYLLSQGYDDLVAVTLFHGVVELVPGFSPLLVRHFGHSTRAIRSVEGLVSLMEERAFHVIGTAPEGTSSAFTYDEPVGPFTRWGLMVAALEAGADIVLVAQKGIEPFGVSLRLPLGMTLPVLGGPRGFLLPIWCPGLRGRVRVQYQRYRPRCPFEERRALPRGERTLVNREEILRIHGQLLQLYRAIPEGERNFIISILDW